MKKAILLAICIVLFMMSLVLRNSLEYAVNRPAGEVVGLEAKTLDATPYYWTSINSGAITVDFFYNTVTIKGNN